jgi:predicted HTH domain antitoxin
VPDWRGFLAFHAIDDIVNDVVAQCVARPESRLYHRKVEKDDEARSAALALLARGMLTPGQAAELAGVSRQLVAYWLKAAGIDWQRPWERRQASVWRREIAALNGKVLRPPTKKELRERARRAKAEWDAKQAQAHRDT